MIRDLHSHSHFSDGALSPAALVAKAELAGVSILALSDHDTTAGIVEAEQAATTLKLIPAVEISCGWEHKEIHVVGLAVDIEHPILCGGLKLQQERRWERAEAINAKLLKDKIPDVLIRLKASFSASAPTRSHFALQLVADGYCKDQERAFRRYLGRKGSAYVAASWCTLEDGVAWIRAAGGIPVLAHPGRYKVSGSGLERLAKTFKDAGGQGFELSYPQLFPKEAQRMAKLVRSLGLWASQGSDFHSDAQRWTGLGRMPPLPPDLVTVWDARPECFASAH